MYNLSDMTSDPESPERLRETAETQEKLLRFSQAYALLSDRPGYLDASQTVELSRAGHDKATSTLDELSAELETLINAGNLDEQITISVRRPEDDKPLDTLSGPVAEVYAHVAKMRSAIARSRLDTAMENLKNLEASLEANKNNPNVSRAEWERIRAKAIHGRRTLEACGSMFKNQIAEFDKVCASVMSRIDLPAEDLERPGGGRYDVLSEYRLVKDAEGVRYPATAVELSNESAARGIPILKALEERIERDRPDLMRLLYPRMYESTGAYHSPKQCAAVLANVISESLRYGFHKAPTAYRLMMPGLKPMIDQRMPIFFVAPDLLQAVQLTNFDEDIAWTRDKLNLPYEHGVFILPKNNMLAHPEDGEVSMLFWSRVSPGNYQPPYPGLPIMEVRVEALSLIAFCPRRAVFYEINLAANIKPAVRLNNVFCLNPGEATPQIASNPTLLDEHVTDPKSITFLEQMAATVFGTFLVMDAEPKLYEPGKLLRKTTKRDIVREFWSPNIIGPRFKMKREVPKVIDGKFVYAAREPGTHASPRAHYRRGHHKSQPYGKGRSERKRIWIAPVWVNWMSESREKE